MSVPLSLTYEGRPLADEVRWARTAGARLRGLLGYPPLIARQALVIEPAAQVHTFGLGYPIDVVFCDRTWCVTHVVRGMRPQRVSRLEWRARYAIELSAGAASGITPGDHLLFDEPRL